MRVAEGSIHPPSVQRTSATSRQWEPSTHYHRGEPATTADCAEIHRDWSDGERYRFKGSINHGADQSPERLITKKANRRRCA